jgi:hypothetical protein
MSRLPCTQLQSDHLRNENNRKWESRNSSTQNSDSENTTELDSRSECIINSVYLLMVQCTPVQLYQNTWPWCRDTTVQYHLVLRTQYIKRVRLVTVRRTERTRPITRAWSKVGTVHYPAYTRYGRQHEPFVRSTEYSPTLSKQQHEFQNSIKNYTQWTNSNE